MTRPKVAGAGGSDRGAVAVEFALVLPLLIALVFGIIDFGRVLNAQVTVTQAAREGARLAALGNSNATVINRTTAAAPGLTGVIVTIPQSCAVGATQTSDAQVQVKYTVPNLILLPSFTVTGKGFMPCQG